MKDTLVGDKANVNTPGVKGKAPAQASLSGIHHAPRNRCFLKRVTSGQAREEGSPPQGLGGMGPRSRNARLCG